MCDLILARIYQSNHDDLFMLLNICACICTMYVYDVWYGMVWYGVVVM